MREPAFRRLPAVEQPPKPAARPVNRALPRQPRGLARPTLRLRTAALGLGPEPPCPIPKRGASVVRASRLSGLTLSIVSDKVR